MLDRPGRHVARRVETLIIVECVDMPHRLVAQDIGLDGMLDTSSVPHWPGTLLRVRFQLRGQPRAIACTCRVLDLVQVPRGVGLSLEFLLLSPEATRAIREWMNASHDAFSAA